MKWGEAYPKRCDLSSLGLLCTGGEPINPEAWVWYWKVIGGGRWPVVRKPWPAMLRGIWGDPERYVKQYWSRFEGV